MRFLPGTIYVDVGDTVQWTNIDPTEPHTVTFGTEPVNPRTLVNVSTDADGALHGTINTGGDSVNSGFLQAAPQDRVGLAQSPSGTTQIRITFTHAGTYDYICALHDGDGMRGKVIVK
jgi:plastocyanin